MRVFARQCTRRRFAHIATLMAICMSATSTSMRVIGRLTTTISTMSSTATIRRWCVQLSLFLFRLYGGRVFCSAFTICPFHPPSILPISSIFEDRAIYFLVSRDSVSQSISKNSFTVSTFCIAVRIWGCFSSRTRKLAMLIASIASTSRVSTRKPIECR